MAVIRVEYTTISEGNPHLVGEWKPYRWRGHADWIPGSEQYRPEQTAEPLPQNAKASAARAARIAEFAGHLKQGLTAKQAGELMGLAASTWRQYVVELKDQQRGEARDG